MMRYLFVVLLLLAPNTGFAQVVKITKPECTLRGCGFSLGTGVVIGSSATHNGYQSYRVLTVYHLTGNDRKQWLRRNHDYQLAVHTNVGRFPAQIMSYNGDMMLMLLSIDVPAGLPEIPALPIADVLPSAGDAVSIHGFSHTRNGRYGSRSVVLRSVAPDIFTITSPFQQGESGGPLIKDGKIIGLCEGYYNDSKIGYGPSVIAIRGFLDLPAIGSRRESGQSGSLSLRPGLPVPPPPAEPTPAAPSPPRGSDVAGDAPEFVGELGPAQPIVRLKPVAEPDPVSRPVAGAIGSQTQDPQAAAAASGDPQSRLHRDRAGAAASVGRAAVYGMDLWSLLAGAGLVAGTGGIGGLALLAWRGLKAGRAVSGVVRSRRHPSQLSQPPMSGSTVASVVPPMVPLNSQNVNFVEVPTDYRRASVDYALAETGRRYPGSIATLEVVKSLINQHLAGTGHGPDTLHP